MEEYLNKLLSQIRCKKVWPYVLEEIKGHIEEQIEDNISEGMDLEEAEKKAIKDMGDPVEVGISLDKIHKPRIAWNLLAVVGLLSIWGIIIQQSVCNSLSVGAPENYLQSTIQSTMTGYISSVIVGFIIMCCVYFLDYTVIAKYAKLIGLSIILLGILLLTGFFGETIHGVRNYIGFGMFRISAASLMMLYIPIYGGILYKYRNEGVLSLLKAIVWLIVPVFITFRIPNLMVALIMMAAMLIVLSTAIVKGWFNVSKIKALAFLWSAFLVLPAALLVGMYTLHLLAAYQEARIRSFLSSSGDAFYLTGTLRNLCKNLAPLGNSGNDLLGFLPDINSDYIFSYIINSYGSIAGIMVIAILATLVVSVFAASLKQKNELGLVMGFGCGMVLLLNIVANLFIVTGMIPPASSFLPFFSVGRSNIILCYTLIGIVLSIYRYKEVYPRHVKSSQLLLQKKFTIHM